MAAKKRASAAKFIQKAIKRPGALRMEMHIAKGKTIPEGRLRAAAKGSGKEAKRARLAMTLRKMRKK